MTSSTCDDGFDELDRFANEPVQTESTTSKKERPLQSERGENFTGEISGLIEIHVKEIFACWHRSKVEIVKLARACAKANRELKGPGKRTLLNRLPFDESTFSKLVKIANDPRIVKVFKRLPPSYSAMYAVSQLSNEQLISGIDTGVINPNAKRADIEALRKPERTDDKPSPTDGQETRRPQPAATGTTKRQAAASEKPGAAVDDSYFDRPEDGSGDLDGPNAEETKPTTFAALRSTWEEKGVLRKSAWDRAPADVREWFVSEVLMGE